MRRQIRFSNQIVLYMYVQLQLLVYRLKIVINHSRCSSKVGKKYAELGGQKVSLGDGCNFEGTITHELLHALGKKTMSQMVNLRTFDFNRHRCCFTCILLRFLYKFFTLCK